MSPENGVCDKLGLRYEAGRRHARVVHQGNGASHHCRADDLGQSGSPEILAVVESEHQRDTGKQDRKHNGQGHE
jgi:hypothetical protein